MRTPRRSLLASLALPLLAAATAAQVKPDAVLLRTPDISHDSVVFTYAGDLWLAPKTGGVARRITSSEGDEMLARFSPDGKRVVFRGGYDGGSDLYVLTIDAGTPQRITHHPTGEVPCDWTPDGKSILFWSSEVSGLARAPRILEVPAEGGQPVALPVPFGTFASLDPSGTWLAYTRGTREFRTWKRYEGGMAQDVWLFDLATHESRRMTDWPGTDCLPMWNGREVIFLSDRGEHHRRNLYSYDMDSGETRQLTDYADTDVEFPAIGPDDVVFQADGKLVRYELASGKTFPIDVTIPGDRPDLRARVIDVKEDMAGASVGPTGVRVAVEARGEVFSVPVEKKGVTRDLTCTDGVAERYPAWSPDGEWIAYFSDRSGEYELTRRRADGKGFDGADENGEERLTSMGPGWKYSPTWSPDAKRIAFATNDGGIWIYDLGAKSLERIHTNPEGQPVSVSWSRDGGWLAWSHRHSTSRLSAIYLYDAAAKEVHEVTSGMFDDDQPVFDADGDWLYYRSSRTFDPIYEDEGDTWIYTNMRNVLAVPLRADVKNPFAPEDPSEEAVGAAKEEHEKAADAAGDDAEDGATPAGEDDDAKDAQDDQTAKGAKGDEDEKDEKDEKKKDEAHTGPVKIDLEGFEARAILLPVEAGELNVVGGVDEHVYFLRGPRTGAGDDEKTSLRSYGLGDDADEEATILDGGIDGLDIAASGKKALVRRHDDLAVIDLEKGQKFEAIDLGGLRSSVRPREEWRQLLSDVHRLYRDFFYDAGMHGVDWDGICARYIAALDDATSRSDVSMFIDEMISELNVGHAYNRSQPRELREHEPARPVGLLGCDWKLEHGAYRIARVLEQDGPYDADARSPLAEPGVDAHVGDFLLAVDGVPVDTSRDVYAAFEGTAGRTTELTLNAEPTMDGKERHVLVKPLASETDLRYRDWVAGNRRHVQEASHGRIGYVHVPNTGVDGQNELVRQFLGQMGADALIVDERWNAGGQIPTRFIELLNRPRTNYWALRHGESWPWPPVGQFGPKAMLINGWAGSGGDAFPYYFREAKLGPLIGERTWGGLVGISGNPSLIDGASPTVPRFAFYELDGTWGVEGFGVPPDVEVVADPAAMMDGADPQLDAAIHVLTEALAKEPAPVQRPAGPDRHGAGVLERDR